MCGIVGKLYSAPGDRAQPSEIEQMLRPIRHRGPDGQGVHCDGPIGLGHCRLSIIDLSTGAQPMANEDESVWIVFNGEIYNFQELRQKLTAKGHIFRSRSDTEAIIHLYEEFGPDCVTQLRGMFAFAIWDAKRQRLFLARDRVGIKPLYYFHAPGVFCFGSELKAILSDPSVPRELHLPAVRMFMAFHYVPGEETLLRNIRKLLPGHSLLVQQGKVILQQYWDLKFTRDRWNVPFDAAAEELHDLLGATVRNHMIADVPVGVLASGGMDSSAVLNFAVQSTGKKGKTFTVGFDDCQVIDERPYARLVSQRFGTEHFDISFTETDFWNFLPSYVWHMEEPVHEPPAVALFYVSKLARDHVKVLLSGEGGDEAFAGYPNYPNMLQLARLANAVGPLSRPAGFAAQLIGILLDEERIQRYGYALGQPLSSHYFSRTSGPSSFFTRKTDFFTTDFIADTSASAPQAYISKLLDSDCPDHILDQMLYVDTKTWLPDDLLIKADKITMANSIELRVPLLDHGILEFAASLPVEFKVRGKETKRILKRTFAKLLPEEILSRKKAGFPVPYGRWLKTGLRAQVEDLLRSRQAAARGYFRPAEVGRLLDYNAKHGNRSREVFCLLVFELWCRIFLDQA
jgi:asparagine synthase (glutamine-hydrolysing)